MFDIYLFKENKRLNSTSRPDTTLAGQQRYSCVFLDSQSIMNPVIIIEDTKGMSAEMTTYNYAYIPNLMRYYFISNCVVLDNSRFCYYLQVDVLASFREDILNTSQYVLRSTSHYNEYITDTMYPTVPLNAETRFSMSPYSGQTIEAMDNKTYEWTDVDFFYTNYLEGSVIFGVTGQGNVSVDYYVCSVTEFKSFINQVVVATPTGYSWGNLPTGVQAALSNFLQYITFAKWLPFMPLTGNIGASVSSISLGSTSFNITAWKITAGLSRQQMRFSITIPDHPLLSRHGYYNLSPYREVNFFFLPVGNIPIDTTKIWNVNTLYCTFIVDLASGDAEFLITTAQNEDNPYDHLVYNTVANIGIDLSLTEYSMSMESALYAGVSALASKALQSAGSYLMNGGTTSLNSRQRFVKTTGRGAGSGNLPTPKSHYSLGKYGTGTTATMATSIGAGTSYTSPKVDSGVEDKARDITGAIGNALSTFGDVAGTVADFIASCFGQANTSGHTGSFLTSVAPNPVVYCWFYKHGEEDYDKFGRPCYQVCDMSNVRGFCLCKDAYVRRFRGSMINTAPMPLAPEIEAIENLLDTGIYIDHVLE